MSRRSKAVDDSNDQAVEEQKRKVEVLTDEAVINGHELAAGTIVMLNEDDITTFRSGGICLGDVPEDDKRDVFDVTAPAVFEDS